MIDCAVCVGCLGFSVWHWCFGCCDCLFDSVTLFVLLMKMLYLLRLVLFVCFNAVLFVWIGLFVGILGLLVCLFVILLLRVGGYLGFGCANSVVITLFGCCC